MRWVGKEEKAAEHNEDEETKENQKPHASACSGDGAGVTALRILNIPDLIVLGIPAVAINDACC